MYYIKIIGFEKDLEEGIIFKDDLYVKIEYNNLVRTTTTKWDENSPNWNEIFIFEEEPINIKILLMDRDILSKDDIKKQGDLPINKANDLLDITFNGITIQHGFVHIESRLVNNNTLTDIELDKNEIFYLKSVIDDKNKIIEEKDNNIKKISADLEIYRSDKLKLCEEKEFRDDLILKMGKKFNQIKISLRNNNIF